MCNSYISVGDRVRGKYFDHPGRGREEYIMHIAYHHEKFRQIVLILFSVQYTGLVQSKIKSGNMLLTTKNYFKEVRSKIHKTTAPWPFLSFKTEFQHFFFFSFSKSTYIFGIYML